MTGAQYPHISPFVFVMGLLSFMVSFLVHLEVWRGIKPRRQIGLLAMIFVGGPGCLFASLVIACQGGPPAAGLAVIRDPWQIVYAFIWHLALAAGYIMSYPAMQADAPSLTLLLAIAAKMPAGLDGRQIEALFSPDALIDARVDDLLSDGLVQRAADGQYAPTMKGRLFAAIFTGYRRLLGLPMGEG